MYIFSVDDIELIHMQIIDASGGSHGTRDRGRLEAAVASQTQAVFGEELYPTMHDKAAALCRGIIADHAFVDGNKRTGIMTALIFLERNDIQTQVSDKQLEDFAVKVATKHLDVPTIAAWLKKHNRPKDRRE
jgi:death on curing protein